MESFGERGRASLPEADERFFRIFVPYEIRLAQRRAMEWSGTTADPPPSSFLGLYLVRLVTADGTALVARREGSRAVSDHALALLRDALRDSDVPGSLGHGELLAVVRDLDPMQAYVVAQRFLSAASRSQSLRAAGIFTRVGYLVYPLSNQANFPADRWETLLDLARKAAERGGTGPATGYGILRGPEAGGADLPETDLVPLAFEDSDSLVRAGLLSLQRIHLLPAG